MKRLEEDFINDADALVMIYSFLKAFAASTGHVLSQEHVPDVSFVLGVSQQ